MVLTTFDPFAEFDRITRRPGIRMDAIRRPEEVELRFDLPGIDTDSLDVTVDRGVLTVSAKRSEEYAEDEKPFIRQRVMGSFSHRVRLSDTVDSREDRRRLRGWRAEGPRPADREGAAAQGRGQHPGR